MGACGCGKSSLARALAGCLRLDFVEGDDFHPPENVEKMRAGKPFVMSCSALRRVYRDFLRQNAGRPVLFYVLSVQENCHYNVHTPGRGTICLPHCLTANWPPSTPEQEAHAIMLDMEKPLTETVEQFVSFMKTEK